MTHLSKLKFLWFGMLLACPPIAVWTYRSKPDPRKLPTALITEVVESNSVKIPVEVIAKNGKAEWVMVEVATENVPEPGTMTLLMTLGSLMLLRRNREE